MTALRPLHSRDTDTLPRSISLLDRIQEPPLARTPPPLRPSREEVERRLAARRRREAREVKAAKTDGLPVPVAAESALDSETRLYNERLAEKIADAQRTDGIEPILKNALEHEPEAARPQITHLLGELRQRAPEQAAAIERMLTEHRSGPRGRGRGNLPDPSHYMEFPDLPEITEAEDVGFWESFLPNIKIGLTTDPIEEALIIRDAFPDEVGGIYQDSFGNPIINFRGKYYYINKPGYSRQDTGTIINAFGLTYPIPRLAATAYRMNKDIADGLRGPRGPYGGGGYGNLVLERYVPPVTAHTTETSNYDIVDPLPSGPPPFIPPDPEEQGSILVNVPPDLEELLTQIPPYPGFTLADKDDIIEIFPDQSDEIPQGLILELRGSEFTENYNDLIRRLVQQIIAERGLSNDFKHRGGARNAEEDKVKEFHLKNHKTGKRLGGSFVDVTFKNILNKRHLHINTVDVRADGFSESSRENQAAHRILQNGRTGDILLLVPKILPGQTVDEDYLRKVLERLVDELLGPKPEQDPREGADLNDLVRRLPRPPTRTP